MINFTPGYQVTHLLTVGCPFNAVDGLHHCGVISQLDDMFAGCLATQSWIKCVNSTGPMRQTFGGSSEAGRPIWSPIWIIWDWMVRGSRIQFHSVMLSSRVVSLLIQVWGVKVLNTELKLTNRIWTTLSSGYRWESTGWIAEDTALAVERFWW